MIFENTINQTNSFQSSNATIVILKDGPGTYYTDWNKSEREGQILYTNAYIWNLERWYWQSSMKGSKEDIDIENRLLDSAGEGKDGMLWENNTEAYTVPYVK